MAFRIWYLLLGPAVLAFQAQAQVRMEVACRDMVLAPGESARVACTPIGESGGRFRYRWDAADVRHLRLLSSTASIAPTVSVPVGFASPVPLAFTLRVETPGGRVVGRTTLRITVRCGLQMPGCSDKRRLPAFAPPQVDCPATLHVRELESATIACHATDPAVGGSASLRYRWHNHANPLRLSSMDVLNPVVMAPPVPAGRGMLAFPLKLAVTSVRSQLVTNAQVDVVVEARDPYLECPDAVSADAGETVVLACRGVDPLGGAATYVWSGLWGTSTAFLEATDVLQPAFAAPWVERDTTFRYVVRMVASGRTAQHRVSVQVRARPPSTTDSAGCRALTVHETQVRPIACEVPAGHHLRWSGPLGPGAPKINDGMLTAPEVDADTVFVYAIEFCRDGGVACMPGNPWRVTVRNNQPPAVTCTQVYDTYSGEPDLLFQCAVSGGTAYSYAWTGTDLNRLSATDVLSPTFDVPAQVAERQSYAYTLTVTDAIIGDASTDVRVVVRKRGQVSLACSGQLEYFVYAGTADFPLETACVASGAPIPGAEYVHRWRARSNADDIGQLSATAVQEPIFTVPDAMDAAHTYQYAYIASARFADPAFVEVNVTVRPFPGAFDMSISTAAVHFGSQHAGGRVTLDAITGGISAKVSGAHSMGRMILSSDKDVDAEVEMIAGVLRHQDDLAVLPLLPAWSVATACKAPSAEALSSEYATLALRQEEGACAVLNLGGTLDLAEAPAGRYAGTLDVVVRAGDVQETFKVPVHVAVVDPRSAVTAGAQGVRLGDAKTPGLTEQQAVSIHPRRALLTPDQPFGRFTLSNPSLVEQEISVRPVFGYAEAGADLSGNTIRTAPTEAVGDLGAALLAYPKVFTLGPGETRRVQYAIREDVELEDRAYATQLEFSSRPRRFVRADRLPEPDVPGRLAHVVLRLPGIYLPTWRAASVSATLVSAAGTMLLEAEGGPFAGTVILRNSDGEELARRDIVLLTRTIVRWSLDSAPAGEVTLHFVARHGDVPPPVTVLWE